MADDRVLVVVNGAAGSAEDDAVQAAVDRLRTAADVHVAATASAEDLDAALGEHADRRVAVLGGDGSVHAVVRALDRAGRLDPDEPLGILPCGTGNDLARTLGLPIDAPVAAADVLLSGTPRRLDVLADDAGGLVVNAVHAGIGARAGVHAHAVKDLLGAVAYPVGAVVAGVTSGGWHLRVTVDGAVVGAPSGAWVADGRSPVLMVAICNGATVGGGAALAPGADPGDGLLDVVVSTAVGPAARAAFAAALATGAHVDRDDVHVVRGNAVTVTGEPVDLDADGEIEPGVRTRTCRVRPGAWSVLVPR